MEHRCERWWNPGVTPSNCQECDKKKPGAAHHDGPETQSMTTKSGAP